MDDHQEEVLQTMADMLVFLSRFLTGVALATSAITMFYGNTLGFPIWKLSCTAHGFALLFNAFAHMFLSGDKRVVSESHCFAAVNILVFLALAVKFW